MCGIAAWIGFGPIDPQIQRLQRAQDAMLHRGPDSAGNLVWSEGGGVLLTHRRLAIQDLSAKGQQPLASADGRMWMIFNGEIYNHLELRAELEQAGHRFGSRCDSEVLLAAYVEWGEAMLGRLVGMFALVILDTRREEVFLARDPLGIKPLYYRRQAAGLELASEIGALLAMDPDEPVAIHRPALWDYLTEGDTDHREATLVDGVNAFPAGCSARIALAGEERAIELSPPAIGRGRVRSPQDHPSTSTTPKPCARCARGSCATSSCTCEPTCPWGPCSPAGWIRRPS